MSVHKSASSTLVYLIFTFYLQSFQYASSSTDMMLNINKHSTLEICANIFKCVHAQHTQNNFRGEMRMEEYSLFTLRRNFKCWLRMLMMSIFNDNIDVAVFNLHIFNDIRRFNCQMPCWVLWNGNFVEVLEKHEWISAKNFNSWKIKERKFHAFLTANEVQQP